MRGTRLPPHCTALAFHPPPPCFSARHQNHPLTPSLVPSFVRWLLAIQQTTNPFYAFLLTFWRRTSPPLKILLTLPIIPPRSRFTAVLYALPCVSFLPFSLLSSLRRGFVLFPGEPRGYWARGLVKPAIGEIFFPSLLIGGCFCSVIFSEGGEQRST